MSVLINGKKIPNNCLECFCLNDEYLYCQAVGRKPSDENIGNTRPDWCPLIEIQPHGDLIDEREVQQLLAKMIPVASEIINSQVIIEWVAKYIPQCSTIIPADDPKEET